MDKDENLSEPPRRQVGALVWRFEKSVLQVLLVNSRDTGRYVIPKGWCEKKLTDRQAAANEAYEEAGIRGLVTQEPIGEFAYNKIIGPGFAVPCIIAVYSMEAITELTSWPEMNERQRNWLTLDQAAAKVNEPELKILIEEFVPIL